MSYTSGFPYGPHLVGSPTGPGTLAIVVPLEGVHINKEFESRGE